MIKGSSQGYDVAEVKKRQEVVKCKDAVLWLKFNSREFNRLLKMKGNFWRITRDSEVTVDNFLCGRTLGSLQAEKK